ncbi:MAG: ferritin-like domain-containing protein [Chloroflexota bacterium]|nr:ferritin-like domain-containing protein [Chloroflexota bacterium]
MQHQVMLDKLSEFLMVEQGGLELYRVAASRCTDPNMKARYEEFGRETAHHREVLIRLIEQLGGDPSYVSPTARVAQFKAAKLLESSNCIGGLGQQEIELNDLENVLLAETKDHADWHLLEELAKQMADPGVMQTLEEGAKQMLGMTPGGLSLDEMRRAVQAAVDEVESEEDEHLAWARETLTRMSLLMAMEGPAPSPERWRRVISNPMTPIEQIHPAPMTGDPDLLPPSKQPMWQESPPVRLARQA